MIGIKVNARMRFAIALYAVLCSAALPFSGHAAIGAGGDLRDVASSGKTPIDPSARTALLGPWLRTDARHASTRARPHGEGLMLTIRRSPIARMTVRQLATYYYGAPQMTFVLQVANPWLAGFRLDRSLSTYPNLGAHRTIYVPRLRGGRPVGPT